MRNQLTVLLVGEVDRELRGEVFQAQKVKSAPHYFEISIPHPVIVGEAKSSIDNVPLVFSIKGYPPDILLIESTIEVKDVFDHEAMAKLESAIYEQSYKILAEHGGSRDYSETYSVFSVSGYAGEPEQFLKHSPAIASLLKSERLELDPKEIEHTMSAQIKYAKNDLAIIDWDGAFLFDPEGDVLPTIELLTLANLQLLRARILDRQLDDRLKHVSKFIKRPESSKKLFKVFDNAELSEDLRQIIKIIMSSIAEVQLLERDIKLIGDWYSARLYDLATHKFKVNEWRATIKEKLDLLEDVYGIVKENFSISEKDRAEWIQIIAWFFLQIGWFVLIIIEFLYFTK